MTQPRTCVIGGAGFIGSHLVEHLLELVGVLSDRSPAFAQLMPHDEGQ